MSGAVFLADECMQPPRSIARTRLPPLLALGHVLLAELATDNMLIYARSYGQDQLGRRDGRLI